MTNNAACGHSFHHMRLIVPIALAVVVPGFIAAGQAQTLRFSPVEKSVVLERAAHAPATLEERQARIRELFMQGGCKREEDAPAAPESGKSDLPNVTCRLPGVSGATILVMANYGGSPVDRWNGASLLPSLFQSLAGRKRRHTFLFVAWAGPKNPLEDPKIFPRNPQPDKAGQIEAIIDLDALGFSPTKISEHLSDKELVRGLIKVAYSLKLSASQVDIPETASPDSAPLPSPSLPPSSLGSADVRGIPRITIHSLTRESAALLRENHAIPDQRFQPDNFFDSYHLISGYLVYLDQTLRRKGRRGREG